MRHPESQGESSDSLLWDFNRCVSSLTGLDLYPLEKNCNNKHGIFLSSVSHSSELLHLRGMVGACLNLKAVGQKCG